MAEYHTYIAGGVRVHNESVYTATGQDLTVGGIFSAGDYSYQVNANGSITNLDTGHTTAAPEFANGQFTSASAARLIYTLNGDTFTPSIQYDLANDGAFSQTQVTGTGPVVELDSGTSVNSGTVFRPGNGYTYAVNNDGSVTNIDTGHTNGGGQRHFDPNTNRWVGGGLGVDHHDIGGSLVTTSYHYDPSIIDTPILIDMDGDGVEYIPLGASSTAFDYNGDGYLQRTAWMGKDDAMLVIDLAEVFDSNNDGVFNAADARFLEFRVWQDANSNGVTDTGELLTLTEAGIASIDLTATGDPVVHADGSSSNGIVSITRTDNTVIFGEDMGLAHDANGYRVVETATGFTFEFQAGDDVDYLVFDEATASVDVDINSDTHRGAFGSDHNDIIDGLGTGSLSIFGGAGVDIINYTGTAQNDVLLGSEGNDTLVGGAENDFIDGGDGNDAIKGVMAMIYYMTALGLTISMGIMAVT